MNRPTFASSSNGLRTQVHGTVPVARPPSLSDRRARAPHTTPASEVS